MRSDALLELIWGEAIEVRGPDELSPLARLLGALLTVPMVTLVAHDDDNRPFAMMESDELLPDAPLGDILAEELGLDVPRDAVVLIEPIGFADAASFSGRALGEELGRVLGDIAATCTTGAKGGHDAIRPAGVDPLRPVLRTLTRDIARILPDTRAPRQDELRAR